MNNIPCDVVLLPSDELARKAVEASEKLQQLGSYFTLEIGKFWPHLSVYMVQLKIEDISKAEELLSNIANKTSGFELSAERYHQSHNYFDAEYQKIEQLRNLQQIVVEALNPLRIGVPETEKAGLVNATGLVLENFKKYGWKSVGELYRPHLTLARFKEEQAESEKLLPGVSGFSGQFPSLGLFEMSEGGTAVRKIAEFKFSGSRNT
jgi:2'-5' RNA ligase